MRIGMIRFADDQRFNSRVAGNRDALDVCTAADHQANIDRQFVLVTMFDQIRQRPTAAA